MSFPFKAEVIAAETRSPLGSVKTYWPLFEQAMKAHGQTAIQPMVALIATIACECHFEPKHEIGDKAYFDKTYGKRPDYELDAHGLWKWRGRGFIQITGKDNYLKYGKKIGVDLIADPDAALLPSNAVKIAIEYLADHGCFVWASRGHWLEVRYLVNGHKKKKPSGEYNWPNGWEHYSTYVYNLLSAAHAA